MPGHYGRRGTIGLATPQANPTAEIEFQALLPAGVASATVRMASTATDPAERLRAYFTELPLTLARFDTLPMQAVALACTGSSYLLGYEAVEALAAELSDTRGHPVISAAAAIEAALTHLNAHSLALVSPYPTWLLSAAEHYWQQRGYRLVDRFSLDPDQGDTRAIYSLPPDEAAQRIRQRWSTVEADAYLVTGTGLPTLSLIAQASSATTAPVLSSNLCLAWAALRAAEIDPAELRAAPGLPLLAGWQSRLEGL